MRNVLPEPSFSSQPPLLIYVLDGLCLPACLKFPCTVSIDTPAVSSGSSVTPFTFDSSFSSSKLLVSWLPFGLRWPVLSLDNPLL